MSASQPQLRFEDEEKAETDESKRCEADEELDKLITGEELKKCPTEESERCLYSNLILILLMVSITCLGISMRYQWLQTCCSSQGSISLGLLSTSEAFFGFKTQETNILSSDVDLKELVVVLVTTVFSGVISVIALFVTSINIWFNSKSCLTGPSAVYFLTLGASLFSAIALAAFLDLYIWNDGVGIVPPKYLGVLFNRDPNSNETQFVPSLTIQNGFYIHLGGVLSSAVAFMLACRLASKLLAGPPHHHQGRDPLRRPRRLVAANRLQVEGTEMDRMDSDKLRPSTADRCCNGRR